VAGRRHALVHLIHMHGRPRDILTRERMQHHPRSGTATDRKCKAAGAEMAARASAVMAAAAARATESASSRIRISCGSLQIDQGR
jgi:hypothetical protein